MIDLATVAGMRLVLFLFFLPVTLVGIILAKSMDLAYRVLSWMAGQMLKVWYNLMARLGRN